MNASRAILNKGEEVDIDKVSNQRFVFKVISNTFQYVSKNSPTWYNLQSTHNLSYQENVSLFEELAKNWLGCFYKEEHLSHLKHYEIYSADFGHNLSYQVALGREQGYFRGNTYIPLGCPVLTVIGAQTDLGNYYLYEAHLTNHSLSVKTQYVYLLKQGILLRQAKKYLRNLQTPCNSSCIVNCLTHCQLCKIINAKRLDKRHLLKHLKQNKTFTLANIQRAKGKLFGSLDYTGPFYYKDDGKTVKWYLLVLCAGWSKFTILQMVQDYSTKSLITGLLAMSLKAGMSFEVLFTDRGSQLSSLSTSFTNQLKSQENDKEELKKLIDKLTPEQNALLKGHCNFRTAAAHQHSYISQAERVVKHIKVSLRHISGFRSNTDLNHYETETLVASIQHSFNSKPLCMEQTENGLHLISNNDLTTLAMTNNQRDKATNISIPNNTILTDYVNSIKEHHAQLRRELFEESVKYLGIEIQNSETHKLKDSQTTETLQPNSVCFSREDYINTGSLGLSLVRIVSLNEDKSSAVCMKARPAHSDAHIYKKPIPITRPTSELYLITRSPSSYNQEAVSRLQLDMDSFCRIEDYETGLTIDNTHENEPKPSKKPTTNRSNFLKQDLPTILEIDNENESVKVSIQNDTGEEIKDIFRPVRKTRKRK